MLLNVLSRRGDGCRAMQQLIRDCHEPDGAKKAHRQRAWQLFRVAASTRQIVEFIPQDRGRRRRCASTSSCRTISRWTRRCRSTCSRRSRCSTRSAGLRARPADAGRVDPREPGDHPAQAARQGEGPGRWREMKAEGIEYDAADGGAGEARVPEAATASSSTPPSTPSPTGTRGWARRTSGPSPSRARCSSSSARSPTTSATTNCSAPRACCCAT